MRPRPFWMALAGNLCEHYDAALFGLLAPFLAPRFFPSNDPALSLILTYALLPIGFLSKPLGALFFGWLGDRSGKRKALSFSLLGMAISTGAIGCLPTYAEIGIWAGILLGFCRAAQGFFAAGETTGGAFYLLEALAPSKRCFGSSLFDASGILGILIGSFCAARWGEEWRGLFLGGALSGLVGAALRWDERETARPPSIELDSSPLQALWKERSAVFIIAIVAGFSYFNYYLVTTFMNGFLPFITNISAKKALEFNAALLLFDLFLLPFFGWLARKISKERLMFGSILAITICAIPLFHLLEGGNLTAIAFVRLTLTLLGVALAAPYHAWVYEKAGEKHRFLVAAMGSSIGSKLLGSPAPAIGLWLFQTTGWASAAALPLIFLGILSLASLSMKSRKSLESVTEKSV